MVFKIPASSGHLKKNQFEFEFDGVTLSLPKIEYVPAEADEFAAENGGREMNYREFILRFTGACDPAIEKKMRAAKLDREQVSAFYRAWLASSKVTPGESSASESS